MIVKVVIETLASKKYAYISGENKKMLSEEIASSDILRRMNGRDKAYFHAVIVNDKLELGDELPAQDW